jgi:manganese/zinc/iron transport system permease protein
VSPAQVEIQLIAAVVAAACALPGTFLVLRRMAMLSDAISHAILPGIVLAFFVTRDLASPWLFLAAAATGVLTVALVELLHRTQRVREDAAIGLVFPLLFSVGVILISRFAGNVHLDTDAVLLGELAFAPFDRFAPGGVDLGPRALWVMGGILLANLAAIALFYKELKLASFDAALAAALGFSPVLLHYALAGLVSLTAVGAFDAVGSILVVALMIAPPAAAYLLTDRLGAMLGLAVSGGVVAAIGGYWLARSLDASIAGSMASVAGLVFALAWLFAPGRGLVAAARRRARQRQRFAWTMLAIHLLQHEGRPGEEDESRVASLHRHLRWDEAKTARVVREVERERLAGRAGEVLVLTEAGRELARRGITA